MENTINLAETIKDRVPSGGSAMAESLRAAAERALSEKAAAVRRAAPDYAALAQSVVAFAKKNPVPLAAAAACLGGLLIVAGRRSRRANPV